MTRYTTLGSIVGNVMLCASLLSILLGVVFAFSHESISIVLSMVIGGFALLAQASILLLLAQISEDVSGSKNSVSYANNNHTVSYSDKDDKELRKFIEKLEESKSKKGSYNNQ